MSEKISKNLRFFNKKKEYLTLKNILEVTNSKLSKNIDLATKITDIKALDSARENQITFFNSGANSGQYIEKLTNSRAGFCLIEESNINKIPQTMSGLICKNPYYHYAQIVEMFYEVKPFDYYSFGNIHPSAKIGKNCQISHSAIIGKNVEIGDDCVVGHNSVILDNVVIGTNCVINSCAVISFAIIGDNCCFFSGVKIGQDGFGFVHNSGKNHKIIQIGIVEIGNNVEIGANSCVDRGALENTIIGDDVKIDNLCQIAHNVEIGSGTVIAGSTAVAGSCKIGKYVQIGGNCSVGGHLKVGDGAKIAGMSGVMRDIEPMAIMAGIPVMPIKKWHRTNIILNKLLENSSR